MRNKIRERDSPIAETFRELTGAPWHAEPHARLTSYEYMMFREEFGAANFTDFLLRSLKLVENDPDPSAQEALLQMLSNKVMLVAGQKFGKEGPEPVYQEIIGLMYKPDMQNRIMRLAELGTGIAYMFGHASHHDFLREMFGIIPAHINQHTLLSFATIMGRLDYLTEQFPHFARASYIAFCCELLKTPHIEPERATKYTPEHAKSRIDWEREEADAVNYAHQRGYHCMDRVLTSLKDGKRPATDIDVLVDNTVWNDLVAIGNSSSAASKFAQQLAGEIRSIRNTACVHLATGGREAAPVYSLSLPNRMAHMNLRIAFRGPGPAGI